MKYSLEENISITSNYNNSYEIVLFNKISLLHQEVKNNLLDPFVKYNYENKAKVSSGLGLFICKELMKKNNGFITYEIKEKCIYFILCFKEK